MDTKLSANRIALAALALCAFLALCVADLGALAQNANSSTTEEHSAHSPAPARGRRGRRGTRTIRVRPGEEISVIAPVSMQERTDGGEKTDLSGTYTGSLTITGGHEMSGEATLTITGDTFTLAGGDMNHNGRVLAVTTRGYTGAAFFFSDLQDPTTNTPIVASVRARRNSSGTRLSLDPVPGTRTRMTFRGSRS